MGTKKMGKTLLCALSITALICLSPASRGEEEAKVKMNEDQFANYESILIEKLRSVDKKKYYFLYFIAAERLYNNDLFDYSEKYFNKAIDEQTSQDKSRAYFRLMQLSVKRADMPQLAIYLKKAEDYFKANPALLNGQGEQLIGHYKLMLDSKSKVSVTQEGNGYDLDRKSLGYYDLFKKGLYKEALGMIDSNKVIRSQSLDKLIELDLLNVLVKGRENVSFLECKDLANKYKDSYAYSVLVCKGLTTLLESGSFPVELKEELNHYFEKFDQDMSFLKDVIASID